MQLKQALEEFQGYLKAELNRPAATIHGYTKELRIFLKYLEKNGQGSPAAIFSATGRGFPSPLTTCITL